MTNSRLSAACNLCPNKILRFPYTVKCLFVFTILPGGVIKLASEKRKEQMTEYTKERRENIELPQPVRRTYSLVPGELPHTL